MVSLKKSLKSKIPKKLINLVPASFDQIGSIALFNDFPKELKKYEKLIGNQLIKLNKNIKTVAIKSKKFSGKYRLQKVRIIVGKKTKETIHKENGLTFKLNIEKTYFSPRTGSERLRIASKIKPKESVLVMFSGIGPFSVLAAKKAKEVYAVEINPSAHKYALENIKLNKAKNLKSYKGDVSTILPKLKKKFNRIIMPLPTDSESYLSLALKYLKTKGIIHFYDFSREEIFPEYSIKKIKKHCKRFKVLSKVKCGNYSPRTCRVCIDFQPL